MEGHDREVRGAPFPHLREASAKSGRDSGSSLDERPAVPSQAEMQDEPVAKATKAPSRAPELPGVRRLELVREDRRGPLRKPRRTTTVRLGQTQLEPTWSSP